MLKIIAAFLLTAVTTLAHAQGAGPSTAPTIDKCNLFAQSLTGKPYNDTVDTRVNEKMFTVRVLARDNARYASTMDYRPDRVNLQLENGTITQASCG